MKGIAFNLTRDNRFMFDKMIDLFLNTEIYMRYTLWENI